VRGFLEEILMSTKYRLAIGAAFAIALTTSVAGLSTAPAVAGTPGQVCYFGECGAGVAPQPQPPAEPASACQGGQSDDTVQKIAEHGSWKALASCKMLLIIDEFDDGSQFGFVDAGDGKIGLVLKNPSWHLSTNKRYVMTISVDGHAFSAMVPAVDETMLGLEDVSTDFVKAFLRGHRAHIQVGQDSYELRQLADAAATLDDAIRYRKNAGRQS
jgi:hypothetical protein